MTPPRPSFNPFLGGLLLVGVLAPACVQSGHPNVQDAGSPYAVIEHRTTAHGYAWDPDAFFYSLATCGRTCPFPPFTPGLGPPTVHFNRSLVAQAPVALFDPLTHGVSSMADAPTGADGAWHLTTSFPSREGPPFFAAAMPSPATALVMTGAIPPANVPIPPGTYKPTLTLRPIAANEPRCMHLGAAVLSDKGILEAVANAQGVSVDALVGRGVAVFWLFQPGPPMLRAPADSTLVTASAGTVVTIAWAPPGMGPPGQSARGYFALPGGPSPLGLFAVLLPNGSPPIPINFTATDTGSGTGRPWTFTPIPGVVVSPGIVAYGEWQAYSGPFPSSAGLNQEFCLPKQ